MTGHATSFEPYRAGRLLTALVRTRKDLARGAGSAGHRIEMKREMDDGYCATYRSRHYRSN
jgi:hypothetical protein